MLTLGVCLRIGLNSQQIVLVIVVSIFTLTAVSHIAATNTTEKFSTLSALPPVLFLPGLMGTKLWSEIKPIFYGWPPGLKHCDRWKEKYFSWMGPSDMPDCAVFALG